MKLLLINPVFPESFWSFSWASDKVTRDQKTVNTPLGIITLAALTPQNWQIHLIDENVEAIDWDYEADIVGVCGMAVQFTRQKEILDHFRNRGIYTVAGGSYASLCPEEYTDVADTVIAGEAERIWPEFCDDFWLGKARSLYQETGEVDLTLSPVPRYDLLKLDRYRKVSLQFSRGCPYRCEFCDIIVMFGRKPRTKTIEQVERELDVLRELNVTSLFFVDDNLIGDLNQAKKLLRFLVDYQDKHQYSFILGTESSLNMASDKELMSLFRKANFEWVFIGVETPSTESLIETGKTQNLREDPQKSIETIYSYGIDVYAGFIVGFDSDDGSIFDRQYEFIIRSGIAYAMVGLLIAVPKTPLYDRLFRASRLRPIEVSDNTRPVTNIIPLKMTYDELIEGYQKLLKRLLRNRAIFLRIRNKIKYLKKPILSQPLAWKQKLGFITRLLFFGVFRGGPSRLYYFLRSFLLGLRRPQFMVVIVTDWIVTLSLKSFADFYLEPSLSKTQRALQWLQKKLQRRVSEAFDLGFITSRLAMIQERAHIYIDLKHPLDHKVMCTLGRTIRQTVKRSKQVIILDCHLLRASSEVQMRILLKKLKRYPHLVHLHITEGLYHKLRDELSNFQCTLVAS